MNQSDGEVFVYLFAFLTLYIYDHVVWLFMNDKNHALKGKMLAAFLMKNSYLFCYFK